MRFLRRNKTEPERPRCPVCREFLTEGGVECQICGHPVGNIESERPEPLEPAPPPAPR